MRYTIELTGEVEQAYLKTPRFNQSEWVNDMILQSMSTTPEPSTTPCKYCGSINTNVKLKGTQTGLYCAECGKWIKWIGKSKQSSKIAELELRIAKLEDKA